MNTTTLLQKSISYEQSRTSLFNLNNHSREDLEIVIDVLESEIKATEHYVDSTQYYLDNAEDLAKGHEADQWKKLGELKKKLQTLLAWRAIFWASLEQVKK